jgi:CRISPR/Cas system-associated endonuclease Cas1
VTASALIAHGAVQVSSQALALCVHHDIGVHWFTEGGRHLGGVGGGAGNIHRRLRQYEALRQPEVCLSLARKLVLARVEGQLRFLLRASRGESGSRAEVATAVRDLRALLPRCLQAESLDSLRDPALGFYHQPRNSTGPLGLDLMEQFRVPRVDMPLVGAPSTARRGTRTRTSR